ncbi:MAG TPA: hypothetical protein VFE51_22040 [Verrucomicrobiae bacterium]|nr:hypothetical protein [Verrucomicrobiae bacterium]
MVTVGLLTFIILGLLLMFNQTQRAFRTGMTQTDVLESGRATMDIMARELEQMTPSEVPDMLAGNFRYRVTNFFAEPSPGFDWRNPLTQDLPGNVNSIPLRTNLIQRFYFLSKLNQDWLGTGYEVVPDDTNGCVGTLYRYSITNYPRGAMFDTVNFRGGLIDMSGKFRSFVDPTNMSRIADGIVHLRLRAFARNGYLLTTNYVTGTNAAYPVQVNGPYTNLPNAYAYSSAFAFGNNTDLKQAACYFVSNALPGYVELELGILEPRVLQKYRSIPISTSARDYLSNHVGQVHIFRQRIPVRNLDLSAYP